MRLWNIDTSSCMCILVKKSYLFDLNLKIINLNLGTINSPEFCDLSKIHSSCQSSRHRAKKKQK